MDVVVGADEDYEDVAMDDDDFVMFPMEEIPDIALRPPPAPVTTLRGLRSQSGATAPQPSTPTRTPIRRRSGMRRSPTRRLNYPNSRPGI